MNKTIITGRVGKDPTVNTVGNKQVCNFSVAVTETKDKTVWFDVSLWEKPAVYPYIKKGGLVLVEGRVEAHSYQKQDGTTVTGLRLQAFQIELLGGNKQEAEQQSAAPVADEQSESLPF